VTAGDYLPDTPDLLGGDLGHVVRASLTHPTFGVVSLALPSTASATVTFDEARTPRVESNLSVPLVEGLEAVDARAGVRLEVAAGYRRPDGSEDVQPFVDLGVRKTPRDHLAGLLGVTAYSDEALVLDAAPAVAEKVTAASPALAVSDLLGKAISPAPYVEDNLTATGAVTIDPVEDRWDALVDLVDRYGAQVYDDGLRTWHARPAPSTPGAPVHTLRTGVGGTVLAPVEDVDRDAWANYVRLRYRWRTTAGADAQVVATAYTKVGPYAITGPSGRKILPLERSVATTQAQANEAARQILLRALSRAETMTIRAVSAYWVRPGDTVEVILEDGRPRLVVVARVAFDLIAGTMTVTTRLPSALTTDADVDALDTTTPPPDPATPSTPKPPVADPAPAPVLAYVTEWPANSTASYRSNGTKRTDVDAGDVWQGNYAGGYNGNQRSAALFTAANGAQVKGRRSEVGKTITQALAGAKVSRVEVVATLEHSWSGAGGDVVLGYLDATALPSSAPTMRPYVTSRDWPRGATRVVNVTSAALIRDLVDGSARAATVGPAPSSSSDYYVRLSGLRLRISYSK